MFISNEKIEETERIIKKYYQTIKEIEWLNRKVEKLEKRREKIANDIKNSNIYFNIDYSSNDYSKEKVDGGMIAGSNIEKSIDIAFRRLEIELENVSKQILDINSDIRSLEDENEKTEHILNKINDSGKKFIELKYEKHKFFKEIQFELNMSKSTLRRFKRQVLKDIYLCLF